jgi:hypothetical protein|tara:strand:+ start:1021 stop:1488 length:468 start_codon:yes stop_codon:yes gene_type:complete
MEKNTKNKLPSRESETRAKRERPKVWTPPSQLDAPPAPEGFKHRWIRAETIGQMDTKNVSARMREGWEFVRADEYPDTDWPQMDSGRYQGVIAVGGLMLARIPNEIVEQRKEYFAKLTQDKDEAVANDPMKDQHPSMPISKERSSRVTFGGKRNT